METVIRTEVYRVNLADVTCRSAEALVAMSVREIDGVRAVLLGADAELIVLASTHRDLHPEIAAAAVSAGLMPGTVSVGPAFRAYDSRPLTLQEAEDLGIVERPRKPVRAAVETVQRVDIVVTDGYDPDAIIVTVGVPVRLVFTEGHGCLGTVMFESLGIEADLEQGGATIDLPALEPGTYPFSCGRRMVHGRVIAE